MKNRRALLSGVLMFISIFNVSCSVFGIRTSETPKYEVLQSEGNKEIRSYPSYIAAKTVVKGEFKEVQNEAFRILAGYIFGDNEKKQKLSMTAPVVQEKPGHQKLAMTAPVVQSATEEGWVMSFVMPSEYKMSDLPTPNDKRVVLEDVPAKTIGVIRFSGFWTASTNQEKAKELKEWLVAIGKYEIAAEPGFAGYDPPWTLPFLRRNEMMYELKIKD